MAPRRSSDRIHIKIQVLEEEKRRKEQTRLLKNELKAKEAEKRQKEFEKEKEKEREQRYLNRERNLERMLFLFSLSSALFLLFLGFLEKYVFSGVLI